MKKIFICMFLLILTRIYGQNEKYSRVKIYLDDKLHSMRAMQVLGLDIDHGDYEFGKTFTSDFAETDISVLIKAGFKLEILIKDVQKYYVDQNLNTDKNSQMNKLGNGNCSNVLYPPVDPANFHLGSYGGYFTYQELLDILDSMRLLYPNLISAKQAIDTFQTIEGRPIYWLRVSNHPDSNQSAKPQMVYTALHHAREPASISQMIYYLWYLLENYATNPEVQAIINNTELYFLPCVNPDGYIFNINNAPLGGGMWRKNRRNNLNGTFGVDLNRNYGYNWGYDNIGSSNATFSDTYRGSAPFSEPETRAIKYFMEQHQFLINLNYHSFSDVLIYPWGYIGSLRTNDSTLFEHFSEYLTEYNNYRSGTCNEVLGYIVNGDANDWSYGEQITKNKTLSFTPEIGPGIFGFYPPITEIIGLCAQNVLANLRAAKLILQHANLNSPQKKSITKFSNQVSYNFQRLGLANNATYTVSLIPLSTWITSTGAPKQYNSVNLLQTIYDSIAYTLNPSIPNGQVFKYILKLNNGLYDEIDTIISTYYNNTVILPINTNSLAGWIVGANAWNTTTSSFYSAPNALTDSPLGNYANNGFNTLRLAFDIDLNNAIAPSLNFRCKWDIEKDRDFVVVEVSDDGGFSWHALCGNYTHEGNTNQMLGEPIFDGLQSNWVEEEMPLDDYLFQTIKLRISLISNQANNKDGFYFDDMEIRGLDSSILKNKILANLNFEHKTIIAYPNPANEIIKFSWVSKKSSIANAKIFNANQSQLAEFNIKSNVTYTFNTSGLAKGMYYCKTQFEDGSTSITKFAIMH